MSLILAIKTRFGIVMASDSRTSDAKTMKPILSMPVYKTILCPNGCGISMCGSGRYKKELIYKSVESFVQKTIKKKTPVSLVPNLLIQHFSEPENNFLTEFLVAGYEYDSLNLKQLIYHIKIVEDAEPETVNFHETGKSVIMCGTNNVMKQLVELQPSTLRVENFTLDVAVDFAKFAIETTEKMLRFQGEEQFVGGPIDILVITPTEKFWAQRKIL